MESFFSRYRSALVLVAVLLAQVIGLASQMKRDGYATRADGHHVRIARAWSAYTTTPVEMVLKRIGGGVRYTWHGYVDLRHVRQHDKDLQYQIDQLRLREASLAEDARQGQRLQRLLAFKEQYVGHTVAAEVIGTGGGDQSRIVTLNKGANDGLKPDMAVITPDGIVGKLRDVFAGSSQVLLLNDPSSGAGVVLVGTRTRGVLRGTAAGQLMIGNLLPDDRIKPGEVVISSGGDRVFPRGLPVGTIKSIKPDPEHQPYAAILIQPAANLDRLEEVLIVTDVAEQLATPIAATAQGEDAIDEAGRKAADIVADRLPRLKQDTPDASTAPGTQAPATTLPKPPPAIHSDRYSPGTVPPAADLQPGGTSNELADPASRPPARRREPQEP